MQKLFYHGNVMSHSSLLLAAVQEPHAPSLESKSLFPEKNMTGLKGGISNCGVNTNSRMGIKNQTAGDFFWFSFS